MYKTAKFFQGFKERHGKNVLGTYKAGDPKPKKSTKIKKNSNVLAKGKRAATSGAVIIDVPRATPKGKQGTRINQTLNKLLAKIYVKAAKSPPRSNAKVLRLKKRD